MKKINLLVINWFLFLILILLVFIYFKTNYICKKYFEKELRYINIIDSIDVIGTKKGDKKIFNLTFDTGVYYKKIGLQATVNYKYNNDVNSSNFDILKIQVHPFYESTNYCTPAWIYVKEEGWDINYTFTEWRKENRNIKFTEEDKEKILNKIKERSKYYIEDFNEFINFF